jgi:hypothetical protein
MLLGMLSFGQGCGRGPVFKIRGKVQSYLAPEAVKFELLRGANLTGLSRTLFDVYTGEFEILDLPPGEYILRATQKKMRGEEKVSVGSVDISGVSIILLPSVTVPGLMRSVGGRADVIRYPNPCNVNLSRDWSHRDAIYVPIWQRDGQFTLDGMFPGEYQVRFLCFGAYVRSASFGGVDLLRNPVITISADAPLLSLKLTTRQAGEPSRPHSRILFCRSARFFWCRSFPPRMVPNCSP